MRVLRNFFRAMPIGPDGQPYRRGFWRALGRLTIMATGTLALGCAAIIGAIVAHKYWDYELPKSKVAVSVGLNQELCKDPQFPLFVSVENNSSRRILSYTVYPLARIPGRSTNLGDSLEPFSSDHIVEPGKGVGLCYEARIKSYRPSDIASRFGELTWNVESFSVDFDDR
jgi:hypothetical protein